jgi:hypothetical protein
VSESVKKYFALEMTPSASALYEGVKYDYLKGNFVFAQPANRTIYLARVSESYIDGSRILMTGEIFNLNNVKDIRGPFYAYAKPWKYGGKDTWALLSLHEGKPGEPAKPAIEAQTIPMAQSAYTEAAPSSVFPRIKYSECGCCRPTISSERGIMSRCAVTTGGQWDGSSKPIPWQKAGSPA